MVKVMTHKNPLMEENRSLKRKNMISCGLAGFFAIVSALSVGSCYRNVSRLEKTNRENKELRKSAEFYQKEARQQTLEKGNLLLYANDAYSFISSIQEPIPTEMDGITSLESDAEKIQASITAEKEDAKAKAEYEKACEVLGFKQKDRQEQLLRLQKGWQQQR